MTNPKKEKAIATPVRKFESDTGKMIVSFSLNSSQQEKMDVLSLDTVSIVAMSVDTMPLDTMSELQLLSTQVYCKAKVGQHCYGVDSLSIYGN